MRRRASVIHDVRSEKHMMSLKEKMWNGMNVALYAILVTSGLAVAVGTAILCWTSGDEDYVWVPFLVPGMIFLLMSGLWLAVNQAIETKHWIKTHCCPKERANNTSEHIS
jgi:hypothetical protein